MLTDTERLMAIEEIRVLKARYFRYVDSHDWAGFRSILADDVVFEAPVSPNPGGGPGGMFSLKGEIAGAEAVVAWVSTSLEPIHSCHIGYMPEIEIVSADAARAIWGMEDILRAPNFHAHGRGYYRETYVRRDGRWLIRTWALHYKSMEARDLATTGSPVF
jgi:hypothetical protein